ncbi:hypothetical protein SAMN02745157_0267 [Kaistia soli DSM 19436]|uniref:DUF1062 domain-containing protein n=1 Tax=Kaistia soli DSM 19436 TaxID=1122133 RepID=A0A1M5PZH5_9HYPH|nr:DUF1062 domain-containing protein [Kaistia soli]SHH06603.1 hypothetical protein SAMN02745157_0267 [Kaistia soli DSM 19436]
MEDRDEMFDALKVRWTVVPLNSPEPWLACSGCGSVRAFRSSDKIRLNANGRRLDAWLIYKCLACDKTWNRPIFERRSVRSLDPAVLQAMQTNDPDWVRMQAFDLDALRHKTRRIDVFAAFEVRKHIIREPASWMRLDIQLEVPLPAGIRLDRLLASELPLSRSRLVGMVDSGLLRAGPAQGEPLRRSIRDGTRIVVDLAGESDRETAWRRAATGLVR